MAKTLGKEFADDVNVASGLVLSLMFDPQGVQGITQALKQTDPVQGMASILSVLLPKVRQQTEDLDIDPRVWTAKGGVIDRVVAESMGLVASLGVPGADTPEFGRAVKQELRGMLEGGAGAPPVEAAPEGLLAAPAQPMPQQGPQMPPQGPGLMMPEGGMV